MPQLEDAYVAGLERENEELREKVRQLEELCGFRLHVPVEFGLTDAEGRLFGHMVKAEAVTKDGAMAVLYGHRPNEVPEIKIVDVFICKMRKKLLKFNVEIETIWGQGYRLPAASKKIVESYLNPQEQEVA